MRSETVPSGPLRPLMMLAGIVILALLAFYVQLLHAAVHHGESLQLQRCAAARATGYVPPHCRP
jgi:hypothetical protein